MQDIDYYLLDFASYGGEPLWILMSVALKNDIAKDPHEVTRHLLWLFKKGYLECIWHPLYSGADSVRIKKLKRSRLNWYIKINRHTNFEDYPPDEGEFFFRTTEAGNAMVPEDFDVFKFLKQKKNSKKEEGNPPSSK